MTSRLLLAALAVLLAACDGAPAPAAPKAGADAAPTPSASAPAAAEDSASKPRVAEINDAGFKPVAEPASAGSGAPPAPDPMLIKAQVLLARANFSPGEVDGLAGSNLRHAVKAFAAANGLSGDGELTEEVWSRLVQAGGSAPVAGTYVLTEADATGPWSPDTGDDLAKAKGLDRVGYIRPTEALAERFHASEELLTALNPGVDFAKPGATIVVPQVGELQLAAVDRIEVDKANAAVRAYGEDDRVLAVFPATVGSKDKPSPTGTHKVQGVSKDPDYIYDPKKLTWGPKSEGKFVVKAGPNNPVGSVWIDLNAPSYGIHGSPEPKVIGKTASHGCVRLTNWDALLLSTAVKSGVKVTFVNSRA